MSTKNEITVFNFKGNQVRTIIHNGEPMFCLSDVCKVLELDQVSRVKSRLKTDGLTTSKVIDSMGRPQEATFINEQNLYKVIFHSRKPEAEAFTDWVTGEVLPSIRKTGHYSIHIDNAASGSHIDPLEAMLNLADQMFDGGREEFLRKIAATQTDLLQSTIRMLNALNIRIANSENVPAHILKYAWNMANCTRTRSFAQFQSDDELDDIRQVFSVFAPGTRIPKNEVYKAYCDSTAQPVSPRAFWPNAKKAVNLRESSSHGTRYVTIIL